MDRGNLLDELRRDAADAVLLIVAGEAEGDLGDVAGGDKCGVRVGGIDDDLQRRCLAFEQLLSKARIDFEADCRLSLIDEIPDLARIGQLPLRGHAYSEGRRHCGRYRE